MVDDICVRSETGGYYIRHGNVRATLKEGELFSRLEVLSEGDWKVVGSSTSNDALVGMAEGLKGDIAQVITRMESEMTKPPEVEAEHITWLMAYPSKDPALINEDGRIDVRPAETAYEGDIIVRANELPDLVDPDGEVDWDGVTGEDARLVAELLNDNFTQEEK